MQQELKKLKRRPFLLPLLLPVMVVAVVMAIAIWVFDARSTTVVIVIRHAETETGDLDPNLSLIGKERAARLARVLAQVQSPRAVDTIFAADTRRAQQTIQPLAEALALPTNVVPPVAWDNLAERIRHEHHGEVVVLAGDAKTLPGVITALTNVPVTIAESDYGNLYIIFVPQLSRTRLLQLAY